MFRCFTRGCPQALWGHIFHIRLSKLDDLSRNEGVASESPSSGSDTSTERPRTVRPLLAPSSPHLTDCVATTEDSSTSTVLGLPGLRRRRRRRRPHAPGAPGRALRAPGHGGSAARTGVCERIPGVRSVPCHGCEL